MPEDLSPDVLEGQRGLFEKPPEKPVEQAAKRPPLNAAELTDQIKRAATSPEEADAISSLIYAFAEYRGETPDEYVGKAFAGVEKTTERNSRYLKQHAERPAKGTIGPGGEALAQTAVSGKVRMQGVEHNPEFRPSIHEAKRIVDRDLSFRGGRAQTVIGINGKRRYVRLSDAIWSIGQDDKISTDNKGRFYRSMREQFGYGTPHEIASEDVAPYRARMTAEYLDFQRRRHENSRKFDVPAEKLARLIADTYGLDVTVEHPEDSNSRYVYVDMPNGGQFKIRFADHGQPYGFNERTGKFGKVGGYDESAGRRHTASDVSIEPSGATADDALSELENRLIGGGKGSVHYQRQGRSVRGETQFLEDGRAIIRAFKENQNVATLAHELGHVFRRTLKPEELRKAEQAVGVEKGTWKRENEERFARMFERYLRDGKAPTKPLRAVFEKFKEWLTAVYRNLARSPLAKDIPGPLREVFDTMLGGKGEPAAASPPAESPTSLFQSGTETEWRKLANIAQTPRERSWLEELDKIATEQGEPPLKPDVDTQAAATKRLNADRQGERQKIIDLGNAGKQLSDEETLIAKQLFQDEAFAALESGDPKKIAEASAFRDAYRATGTEQARAFRQRRDPLNGKTIIEATPKERLAIITDELFDRPQEQEKKRQKYLDNGDLQSVAEMNREFSKKLTQIENRLNAIGLSLSDLPKVSNDPIQTARVRNEISAQKKTFWDKLFEYRSSLGLFSGPATQVANFAGNLAHGAYDYIIQAPTEAVVNEMMRAVGKGDPAGRRIKEFPYLWHGIREGVSRGMQNAILTWKTELPVSEEGAKFDAPNVAIGGKLGRIIRAPGYRMLSAADEFFNTLFSNIEVGGAAFRTGLLKGLSGPELAMFIHDETLNQDSLSWKIALHHANELTFHQQLEGVAKKTLNAAMAIRHIPGMRWFIPVVSFPVKSATIAFRKAPVTGDVAMMKAAYDNWRAGRPATMNMSRRFAERALAWGATIAIASTLDDKDPWITGAATNPPGTPPSSVKLFGQWFSYSRIEPFALIGGMMVDGISVLKGGSANKIVSAPFDIASSQFASKTFLQGLSDVMTLLGMSRDSSQEAAIDRAVKYSARFGESFVPNFYRQIIRAGRSARDEQRIWGKTTFDKAELAARRVAQATMPIKYEPKVDPWGRPMPSGVMPFWSAPLTDYAWRLLSPVYQAPNSPTRGDQLIARWNAQNPDQQKSLNPPSPYFTANGKSYALTAEEYEKFQITAGQLADSAVSRIPLTDNPTEATMKRIEVAIKRARDIARLRLMNEWKKSRRQAS